MSGVGLGASLLQVGGILLLASVLGRALVPALVPNGDGRALERWGWSIAVASVLLAAYVSLSLGVGLRPGWVPFLALAFVIIALTRSFSLREEEVRAVETRWSSPSALLLLALTAAGVGIYAIRALSEPMWSNDFLAVWGLKGKTIFGSAGIPQPLFHWHEFEFTNPAYPIGLPLLYAGIGFLLGRWDDHATALVFPMFQLGTLLVLVGWLRRRGTGVVVALAASAFVANLGVLYSAWLTGMAEVPASFAFLLLGAAMSDVVDDAGSGSVRRLFVASLLAAATKNEGVFLVGTASVLLFVLAFRRRDRRLWLGAAAVVGPGLGSVLMHRLFLGGHSIRGLEIDLLWRTGLGARVAQTLREEWIQLVRPVWPGIAAVFLLVGLGSWQRPARTILVLGAASLATYLALPILCPLGPGWLIHWTVGRIVGALVPLLAAGVALAWAAGGEPQPFATE